MAKNIVKVKLDIIFKKLFGVEENEDVLRSFLSSMLEIPINDIGRIIIKNTEVIPEQASGKFSRMDLRMQVKNRMVNIEIQLKEQTDYKDRTLFYWSKLYSNELKSGEEYGTLKESICINILNFNLFECDDFHSHFKVMENTRHEVLSDKFAIHFFELKKINRKVNSKSRNKMELWLQLINAETQEELDMLKNVDMPEIQKAVLLVEEMSEDEKIQEIARIREKQLHDEATALGSARREGRAELLAEIAKDLRKDGMSESQIKAFVEKYV